MARGLLTATVASGLGLVAHVAAGGLLPAVPWLILIYVPIAAVVIASMGVPAGLFRLVALVGGGQFATHLMLTALAGHAGDNGSVRAPAGHREESVANMATGRRGSLYDLTLGPVEPPSGGEFVVPHWLTHVLDDLTGPHAAMAVAHLAAAAVVAWWLAQGESALWTIIALLGASMFRALTRLVRIPRRTRPSLARRHDGPTPSTRRSSRAPARPEAPLNSSGFFEPKRCCGH